MNKTTEQSPDLNKSIDSLIGELFEDVKKGENFEVASASKTTADAAIASAPTAQDDAARGAGRPKQISDVPKTDQDGKREGQYDASIADNTSPTQPEETSSQIKVVDQTSSAGRLAEAPKMKDPRLSKSEQEELAEFRKAKADQEAKAEQLRKSEELKKAEDIKKAELENLVKSAVAAAVAPIRQENEALKKSLTESQTLLKAMSEQPREAKTITGIDAIEKSYSTSAQTEFTREDKLDAAEALYLRKSLPLEAVTELSSTGTIQNPVHRQLIEAELQKQN